MTEKELILKNLETVAEAVVNLFGKNCEACVHDLTRLQDSLVYIAGNVTRRRPGAPATDLLLRLLKEDGERPQSVHNYKTTTEDGRSLKSTTTFIKQSDGKPIAAFCINFDTTDFYNASRALHPFHTIGQDDSNSSLETFAHSVDETISSLFAQAMTTATKHPTTMNLDEKIELVRTLEDNGAFQLKGAVEQVAAKLGVTRYTVYNYLKKIRTLNSKTLKEK